MLKIKYSKISILILIIILILTVSVAACGRKDKRTTKTDNTPSAVQEQSRQEEILSTMNALLVQEYLKQNISELSPEKEVLGGKFYLTNLKFVDNKNAEVDYEDGHVVLRARVNFVIEAGGSGDKSVKVNSFEIIEE